MNPGSWAPTSVLTPPRHTQKAPGSWDQGSQRVVCFSACTVVNCLNILHVHVTAGFFKLGKFQVPRNTRTLTGVGLGEAAPKWPKESHFLSIFRNSKHSSTVKLLKIKTFLFFLRLTIG